MIPRSLMIAGDDLRFVDGRVNVAQGVVRPIMLPVAQLAAAEPRGRMSALLPTWKCLTGAQKLTPASGPN